MTVVEFFRKYECIGHLKYVYPCHLPAQPKPGFTGYAKMDITC